MTARIWLGPSGAEQLLPAEGRTLTETDHELVREERTANGTLVWDVIGVKRLFALDYSVVTGVTLALLRGLYVQGQGAPLTLRVEREGGGEDSYQVRFRPFSRRRYLTRPGEWLWEDISVTLEEI